MIDQLDGYRKHTGRCLNPAHHKPAGWCSTCGSEWDHTADLTEEQLQAAFDSQVLEWREALAEADRELLRLKTMDPRDVVRIVETRKRRNEAREKIENLGAQWRVGGNAPTKADNR